MLCSSMSVHHSWLTKKKKKELIEFSYFPNNIDINSVWSIPAFPVIPPFQWKNFSSCIKLGPLICALDYILSGMLSPALSTFPIPLDCFHYSWYKNNKILNHINVLKLTLWFSAPIFEKVKSWSSYLHFLISHSLFHLFFFLILFSYYTRM